MDQLIKRGIAHIVKLVPKEEPIGLTDLQLEYFNRLTNINYKPSEIFQKIWNDELYIPKTKDELWLTVALRKGDTINKYCSMSGVDLSYLKKICIEMDFFAFKLEQVIQLMMKRFTGENEYFTLVKLFYSEFIKEHMKLNRHQYFSLTLEQLQFIDSELNIDTIEFMVSPKAYKLYLSKNFDLLGIPTELNENRNILKKKLLEMTDDIVSFYNGLRKLTEKYLNIFVEQGYEIVNLVDDKGIDIVDYPIFSLKFSSFEENSTKIKIVPKENSKNYTLVYGEEIKYTKYLDEEKGKTYLLINQDFYKPYEIDPDKDIVIGNLDIYDKNFLNHFGFKFQE